MLECIKRFLRKNIEIKTLGPKLKTLTLYPEDYLENAMRITGDFEGSGYGNVTGNFDGQGISVGMLQWNYGQGTLQSKILGPFIRTYGESELDSYFPEMVSNTYYMTPKQAVNYAKKKMLDGNKLNSKWHLAWKRFISLPKVQELQIGAAEALGDRAWSYCEQYNMKSLKSFCWFFDIVVQNGSLKGVDRPMVLSSYSEAVFANTKNLNRKIWGKDDDVDDESKTLFIWITNRVVRNKWASDVIDRKGTIAHGIGYVHGNLYNFSDIFNKKA